MRKKENERRDKRRRKGGGEGKDERKKELDREARMKEKIGCRRGRGRRNRRIEIRRYLDK